MQRTRGVHRDEGQVHFVLGNRREFLLGLLAFFLQSLKRQLVVPQIDAGLLLELIGEVLDDAHVEVFTAEEGVAVGRLHLEDAVADLQDRDVEGAAAQVVDDDLLAVVLVQAVGERRSGRLVDDAQDFQAGDLAGVLGRLTLGVVEVGRNRDDGLLDLFAEMLLSSFLHLLQDEGRDLLGRIVLAVGFHPGVAVRALYDLVGHHVPILLDHRVGEAAADKALDGEQGVGRVGDSLALGRLADEAFAVVEDGDNRRRGPNAFGVLDHFRLLAVHDGHARIGRAQVDADDLAHIESCSLLNGGRRLKGLRVKHPVSYRRPRFE